MASRYCAICRKTILNEAPWVSVTWDGREVFTHNACEKAKQTLFPHTKKKVTNRGR